MPEDAWGGHLLWTADLSSYPSPGALRCEADFSVIGLSEHCNGNP